MISFGSRYNYLAAVSGWLILSKSILTHSRAILEAERQEGYSGFQLQVHTLKEKDEGGLAGGPDWRDPAVGFSLVPGHLPRCRLLQ